MRYHTPRDTVGAVNRAIVQDHGDTMLALARHFGNLDLNAARSSGEDLMFFSAPVLGLVAYPIWLARVLAVVASILFIAVIVAAWRRGSLSLLRALIGALALLAIVVLDTVLASGAWELVLSMHPGAQLRKFPDFEGSAVAMAAIFAVVAVAFVATSHLLSRWIGAVELTTGALVLLMVLNLMLTLFMPLGSALALWPLLGGVAALAVVAFFRGRGWAAGVLLALAAVPGLVIISPLLVPDVLDVEEGATQTVPALLLFLGSLLPQLLLITGRLAAEAEDHTKPAKSTSQEQPLNQSS